MNDKIMTYIEEFRKEFTMGLEAIRSAARTYTAAVTEFDGEASKAFKDAFPAVSDVTWKKLLLIGTFQAEPIILLLSDRTSNIIAKKTPLQQKKLASSINNGVVEVLKVRPERVRRVKVQDLTAGEEERVIDAENCRVRTVDEQRKLVEREKKAKKARIDFEVVGTTLKVYRRRDFSLSELLEIVERMKASDDAPAEA